MTPQPNQQVPLAFIDRTGYVTPFNGIMDRTLDGWYIYDEITLKKALEQMRRLEEERVRDEIGIIDVQYSVNEEESESTGIGQDAPEFARDIFGVDKVVPFLGMGKQAPATDSAHRQAPEYVPPPPMDLEPGQVPEIVPPPRTALSVLHSSGISCTEPSTSSISITLVNADWSANVTMPIAILT